MRGLLIALLCLAAGAAAALGYSHYLGEGKDLADLKTQMATEQDQLTKATTATQQAQSETSALSAQVQQLTSTKDDLKHQLDAAKAAAAPAPAPPASDPNGMAGIMKASVAARYQARLALLTSRLHLTPDQVATLKAAMDQEAERATEMASKMFSGGKVDPSSFANVKGVEQTLNDILTPDQKTQYQQVKTEEKTSAAEMMASVEMNQYTSTLQLSDTQKDQVYSALAQVQMDTQDPAWIRSNVANTAGDPMAVLEAQNKAKDDALSKILTPDQMTTYRQQVQSQLDMQRAMIKRMMPNTPATTAPAVTPSAPVTP